MICSEKSNHVIIDGCISRQKTRRTARQVVYITPHVSGGYQAGMNYTRVIDTAIRKRTLVLNGRPPIHEVDRKLGY